MSLARVPVIDLSSSDVPAALARACREHGFFYVSGHGVSTELQDQLEKLSRDFFRQDLQTKNQIAMARGGHAWRGYFPVGGELTSGKPDLKEGIYFGQELAPEHPSVRARRPLHGANIFPDHPLEFRAGVLEYIREMTRLGHQLMRGLALSLELPSDYFERHYTGDPFVLFRIFNYPAPQRPEESALWGVGEHTDYGILTILKQDSSGGLEIKTREGWIQAPPIKNTFVCNIGDMLDRMTRGLYRSTPHRVRNTAGRDRLSFPFFFDPAFDAEVKALPLPDYLVAEAARIEAAHPDHARWDGADLRRLSGTYGEYLLKKVAKVFPELGKSVLS